jgi:hypothetical protein
MKALKIFEVIILLLALVSCRPMKQADRTASKNEVKAIFPEQGFDSLEAKKMLTFGNATIKGLIYKKTNKLAIVGGKQYGANVKISLFPATPYLIAWHTLRTQKENKRTKVYMSDEANKYRIDVVSDAYGRFNFEKMKPGKYFIHAIMMTRHHYTGDVEVGSNSYGTKFYEKQRTTTTKYHRLESFIEVKNDKELIEIVLK